MTLDRGRGTHVVMASQAGGMEIEEVAATHPEKIVREWTDPALGLQPFQARNLAFGLGLSGDQFKAGVALILNLFRAYLEKDCSLAEINPLVVTRDGRVMALDAKLNFDDNALYRHKELVALRDTNEETPLDVEASKYGLNYIKLDGSVGCMVNGAGLAMATMDIVKLAGGEPPTSSTWAVAPPRSRSRTPSAFSPPIRPSRPCSSTCSGASSASIASPKASSRR
jgi:succinyl-CoA synthetase beta subunit